MQPYPNNSTLAVEALGTEELTMVTGGLVAIDDPSNGNGNGFGSGVGVPFDLQSSIDLGEEIWRRLFLDRFIVP